MRILEGANQPSHNGLFFVKERAAYPQTRKIPHMRLKLHFMKAPTAQRLTQVPALHARGREQNSK